MTRGAGRAILIALLAACAATPAAPVEAVAGKRLPPPKLGDPSARGASYLAAVAAQLQSRWADFLEDCRLRLPAGHPLNNPALVATFELAIARDGTLAEHHQLATSGSGDFDTAVSDVLADASPLPAPPDDLISDDDRAHLRWQFARDRRQAGAATARVELVELPLLAVIDGQLARGELGRAARRIARATGDRTVAAEHAMIAALREALVGPDGAARRAALEACARTHLAILADAVRVQLAATSDPDLRLAAILAAGALRDRASAPALLAALRDELVQHARTAGARIAALVELGQADAAADAVRAILDGGPNPTALAALALVPIPALAPRLAGWSTRNDPAIRGAVCAALPSAAPAAAAALILRGLRDADATVRATCTDAAARTAPDSQGTPDSRGAPAAPDSRGAPTSSARGAPAAADSRGAPTSSSRGAPAAPDSRGAPASSSRGAPAALVARLHELARDRDRSVRAGAVGALGVLDPAHPVRAAGDPAPEVRAAFARGASLEELRALAGDREPQVRAAALAALGERAGELAVHAAADPAPAVRRAAIAAIVDPAVLARLARDDAPDVATAALVRATALRGRDASTTPLLEQLAAAPAASAERVRIALAWLLAR